MNGEYVTLWFKYDAGAIPRVVSEDTEVRASEIISSIPADRRTRLNVSTIKSVCANTESGINFEIYPWLFFFCSNN